MVETGPTCSRCGTVLVAGSCPSCAPAGAGPATEMDDAKRRLEETRERLGAWKERLSKRLDEFQKKREVLSELESRRLARAPTAPLEDLEGGAAGDGGVRSPGPERSARLSTSFNLDDPRMADRTVIVEDSGVSPLDATMVVRPEDVAAALAPPPSSSDFPTGAPDESAPLDEVVEPIGRGESRAFAAMPAAPPEPASVFATMPPPPPDATSPFATLPPREPTSPFATMPPQAREPASPFATLPPPSEATGAFPARPHLRAEPTSPFADAETSHPQGTSWTADADHLVGSGPAHARSRTQEVAAGSEPEVDYPLGEASERPATRGLVAVADHASSSATSVAPAAEGSEAVDGRADVEPDRLQAPSLVRRMASLLLDLLFLFLVPAGLIVGPVAWWGLEGNPAAVWSENLGVLLPFLAVVFVLLETLYLGAFGRTPGLRLTGLCIVDGNGRPPGFGLALLRALTFPVVLVPPLEASLRTRTTSEG